MLPEKTHGLAEQGKGIRGRGSQEAELHREPWEGRARLLRAPPSHQLGQPDASSAPRLGGFSGGRCASRHGACVWCAREKLRFSRGEETQAQLPAQGRRDATISPHSPGSVAAPSHASVSPLCKRGCFTGDRLHILIQ